MVKNNSSNQDYTNNSDGWDLTGGTTTRRKLTVTGADITVTGSGTNTHTFQNISGTVYESGGGDVLVTDGGTGASTASGARTNLGAAASGANSDITSITGLSTPLAIGQGGTGSATQNFVDLSTTQFINGTKNFNSAVNISSTPVTLLTLLNTTTPSSVQGAGIGLYNNDNTTITPSGSRLGFLIFGGGNIGTGASINAAAISAYSTSLWSASNGESEIRFETMPSGSTTRATTMTIKSSQLTLPSGVNIVTSTSSFATLGNVTLTSFKMGTSTTAGYILTTDASGNGTWQAANVTLRTATKTTSYTVSSSDTAIFADATSGNVTITLPLASGLSGYRFYIKRVDNSANSVTITRTSTDTIDGQTSFTLDQQYTSFGVISNGSTWYIL
jgi:hypothetical protein